MYVNVKCIKELLLLKTVWFWCPFQVMPDQTKISAIFGELEKEDPEIPSSHKIETGILENSKISYLDSL